jgi:hypothetical protein
MAQKVFLDLVIGVHAVSLIKSMDPGISAAHRVEPLALPLDNDLSFNKE